MGSEMCIRDRGICAREPSGTDPGGQAARRHTEPADRGPVVRSEPARDEIGHRATNFVRNRGLPCARSRLRGARDRARRRRLGSVYVRRAARGEGESAARDDQRPHGRHGRLSKLRILRGLAVARVRFCAQVSRPGRIYWDGGRPRQAGGDSCHGGSRSPLAPGSSVTGASGPLGTSTSRASRTGWRQVAAWAFAPRSTDLTQTERRSRDRLSAPHSPNPYGYSDTNSG